MKRLIALLFAVLLVASACAPLVERNAEGAVWYTTESLMQYKRVPTGYIGKIPTYDNRWRSINSSSLTGTDKAPVLPRVFDCVSVKPASPKTGDKYCAYFVKYYLLFGDKSRVEVEEIVWRNNTSDTIYKIQETLFGLQIVP